ncbi:hypothetical protein [Brucella anthropi]|uniref:Lipoprotein n=1 Tax=Brucella anthropi TaxID=529 RepID=A0A6L3YZY6_BRUAN|nr:hypothetical protein [Brucella anthropi]KAB2763062.1 hypothetical protein F9L04_21740 [Brucella anthropi]UVV67035.1 hypothetical protein NW321_11220 [Brucella anthropi]
MPVRYFRALLTLVLALALGACTTSKETLRKNPKSVGKAALCRSMLTTNDIEFQRELIAEAIKRGITAQQCVDMVKKQNEAIAAGVAIAAIGTAVAVCANNNCGGGTYRPNNYQPNYNYGYAWDLIRNQYGTPVYVCRSRSNGQFAYDYECAGMVQNDFAWPGY